jgi:hypothetical protein
VHPALPSPVAREPPISRDRADASLVRRTALWLRDDPEHARRAGLTREEDARALAALLDMLGAALPDLGGSVRRTAVGGCRAALGLAPPRERARGR